MMFLLPAQEEREGKTTTPGHAKQPAVADSAAKSEQELGRILEKMRPGRMGVSTDRATLTEELNRWARIYANDDDQLSRLTNDAELRRRLLSEDLLAHTQSERFLPEDVSHVRETMLCRSILDSVGKSGRNDQERLVRLFEFVTRTITPIPEDLKRQLPLTPYESLLFGIGTATDRAWTIAAIVAQSPLSMDAVVLRPRDEAKRDHWLVGIINADGKVALFDPHDGMPIPAPGDAADTPLPKRAGTLDEVIANPELLRRLDVPDLPYPLLAEDLKTADVLLIGNTSQWSPRMAKLRFLMPGILTIDVYQGLGPNELRKTGAYDRVLAAGESLGWNPDTIAIWDYPDQQRALIESAKGAEATQLAQYFEAFRGPLMLKENRESGQIFFGPADKSLHYVRMLHLTGNHSQALQDYLPIRSSIQVSPDGRPIPVNLIVADYAAVWSGICQFETGRPGTALQTFERYVKSGQGGLTRTAVEWEAQCHAAEGRYDMAAQRLAEAPPGLSPRRDAWLIARWKKLAGEPAQQPTKEPGGVDESPSKEPRPAEPSTSADPAAASPESISTGK